MNNFKQWCEQQIISGYADAALYSQQYVLDNDWEIVESLNHDLEVKQLTKNSGFYETMFSANEKIYRFIATIKNNSAFLRFYPFSDNKEDYFNKKGERRSSAIVFSGVLKSVDMMIKHYPNLEEIVFDAAYKELKNLYKTMTYMIKKRYPEWKINVIVGKKFIYRKE